MKLWVYKGPTQWVVSEGIDQQRYHYDEIVLRDAAVHYDEFRRGQNLTSVHAWITGEFSDEAKPDPSGFVEVDYHPRHGDKTFYWVDTREPFMGSPVVYFDKAGVHAWDNRMR